MKRIIIAVTASTLATTAAIAGLILILFLLSEDKTGAGIGIAIIMAYGISAFIGLITVGLPAHLVLSRYSSHSIGPYLLIGAVIPIAVIFIVRPFGNDPLQHLLVQSAISGGLGIICAAVFWYFAAKPNKRSQPRPLRGPAAG